MSKKNKDRGKRHERTVAKMLGGKRIGILGKEDISHPKFSIECKSREDIPKWFKDFWEQTLENCEEDKVPMLVIHETQKRYKDDWVVIRMEDFLEVLDETKT